MSVERSEGVPLGTGLRAGGGYSGITAELDALVQRSAELLVKAYGMDVTIRFNSDRHSGGAWLLTHRDDRVWANAEIGITATLVTQDDYDAFCAELRAKGEGVDWVRAPGLTMMSAVSARALVDASREAGRGRSGRDLRWAEHHTPEEAVAYLLRHARVPDTSGE